MPAVFFIVVSLSLRTSLNSVSASSYFRAYASALPCLYVCMSALVLLLVPCMSWCWCHCVADSLCVHTTPTSAAPTSAATCAEGSPALLCFSRQWSGISRKGRAGAKGAYDIDLHAIAEVSRASQIFKNVDLRATTAARLCALSDASGVCVAVCQREE